MPQPLVYVVILNWNLREDTAECVRSVLSAHYSRLHLLVVDNGSEDGSPEYLMRLFPGLDMVVNAMNVGFSRGNNVGIRRALDEQAEYVFLLNNDAVVDARMFDSLVACAEGAADVGIVAPKILYYGQRDRIWHLGGRARRWLPVPETLGHNQRDDGRFTAPLKVDYVTFCGALLKRRLLESIGLLDERFPFAYEDSDFCCRARTAGYRILCQPEARMWHKASLSSQRDAAKVKYLKAQGRAMFYRLHPHGPSPGLTTAFVWASTLAGALKDTLRGDVAAAASALRGLYHGYRIRLETP